MGNLLRECLRLAHAKTCRRHRWSSARRRHGLLRRIWRLQQASFWRRSRRSVAVERVLSFGHRRGQRSFDRALGNVERLPEVTQRWRSGRESRTPVVARRFQNGSRRGTAIVCALALDARTRFATAFADRHAARAHMIGGSHRSRKRTHGRPEPDGGHDDEQGEKHRHVPCEPSHPRHRGERATVMLRPQATHVLERFNPSSRSYRATFARCSRTPRPGCSSSSETDRSSSSSDSTPR
jgi:hypothetical protein